MFYEVKEGLAIRSAISLDGVRCVRIRLNEGNKAGYYMEILYTDQTIFDIDSSVTEDDLLPAYREILKLLGCRGHSGVIRYCAACGALEPGEERKAPRTPVDKSFDICDSHTWPQYRVLCPKCGSEMAGRQCTGCHGIFPT